MTGYIIIAIVCFLGGALQSSIGFGCSLVLMSLLPNFLGPIQPITGLTSIICFFTSVYLVLRYRCRPANFRVMIPVLIVYIIIMPVVGKLSSGIPTDLLKSFLGIALIVLSIYYLAFSGKQFKISGTFRTAASFGLLSGILSGLFTIGGPPVVIYTMSVAEQKEDYMGMVQFYFLISNLYSCIVRTAIGIITFEIFYWVIAGLIGVAGGLLTGGKLQKRLNWNTLRRCVYVFIGMTGVYAVITGMLSYLNK